MVRKDRLWIVFASLMLAFLCNPYVVSAASSSDSVSAIPEDTVFTLAHELEVPAHARFILLGQDGMQDFFNQLGQVLNDQAGRYYSVDCSFGGYVDIFSRDVFASYNQCLERHRRYWVTTPGTSGAIINNGDNNTNIIISNELSGGASSGPEVYSCIGDNPCSRPEFTFCALILDPARNRHGGFFKEGHEFKVTRVRTRERTNYNEIVICFDHDVATGLVIMTTSDPSLVSISQLEMPERGQKGLWKNVGACLGNMNKIAGSNFYISFPEKRYFD